ncbi:MULTISPECIES: DEAD/DEAH box helicase [Clostridium]|uniref:DEAD/DEAH box helicase n=1 Tax=Clostridium TaxID=1485 RepID=UPI0018AAA424|nr:MULTISPECIES: DEAD/DEAH box helicase [Clostridium]MBS5884181.1 DEAD/DEAH box helicase [Clostridium sp.]MDB1969103.1 DEAD/DEAH box helicase [Clostridium tertium]MDU3524538.1 DEAD/DEAH box helicase [Clostridium sp.]MDU7147930.1 DEAD/DEAH box helicase [Clostridium sp.]
MNLKAMMDSVLKLSSSISKNNGIAFFKNGLVSKVVSKKINDTYHIYGRVLENKDEYSTHLKFDSNNKIIDTKCSCNQFEENSKEMKNYFCSHLVATMYRFYYAILNNKENIKNDKSEINKRILKLDIKIKQVKVNRNEEYHLEFRSGEENTIAVEALGKFLFDENNKFNENDTLIIDFFKAKFKENKSRIVDSRSFVLYKNEIRSFFKLVDNNKSIVLTYDYMNYNSTIYKEDMPLIFTLKKKGEALIVNPQKKSTIPIDDKKSVWIYDKKIYLPTEKQLKYYKAIYDKLAQKGSLIYKNTESNLKKLLFILGEISKDIIIDETVKYEINKVNTPRFYIEKENENIYCSIDINYENSLDGLKDSRAKEKIEMELERYKFIKHKDKFIFIGNDEDKYILLSEGINHLNKIGIVTLSNEFDEIKLIKSNNIRSEIEEKDDYYKFDYKIDGVDYNEIAEIMERIKNGSSFYKTKENNFLDLKDMEVVEFFKTIEELNLFNNVYKEEIYVDKFNLLHLENKIKNKRIPFITGEEKINELINNLSNKEKNYEVPKELKANLREYQVKGYNWLRTIENLGFGGILADDMGLGKTIQTITLLLSNKNKKSLIITPTSVVYNWKSEFEKFADTLNVGVIHGSVSERNKVKDDYKEYDVLLTTYGTLRSDYKWYEDKKFDFCIIDEAQNIKNKKSKVSDLVKSIKANCKLALTGTPIENNLLELWSIFDFIMPGYLYNEERFKGKFLSGDDESLKELKELISPFILRRLKEDVLDELPDKIEKEYLIPMTFSQKQIYNSYMKEVKKKIKENKKIKDNKIVILSYLTKLRQLCLDPSLLIDDFKEESAKIKAVKEIIKETIDSNKKIIIFSQFTSVLKKIGNKLEEDDINYLYLDGSIKAKERINLVDEFNNRDKNIFLISLKAGGVGLNLTSASVVVHFDPWWNPAVQDQATDRAHRIGQKNIVEVIKLISKDTIEEKIIKLQEEKKELISKIIDGDTLSGETLNTITEEELLKLFS